MGKSIPRLIRIIFSEVSRNPGHAQTYGKLRALSARTNLVVTNGKGVFCEFRRSARDRSTELRNYTAERAAGARQTPNAGACSLQVAVPQQFS